MIKINLEKIKKLVEKYGDSSLIEEFSCIEKSVQKEIPKIVYIQLWMYTGCPTCDYTLSTHYGDGYHAIENEIDRCPRCGQLLEWE